MGLFDNLVSVNQEPEQSMEQLIAFVSEMLAQGGFEIIYVRKEEKEGKTFYYCTVKEPDNV